MMPVHIHSDMAKHLAVVLVLTALGTGVVMSTSLLPSVAAAQADPQEEANWTNSPQSDQLENANTAGIDELDGTWRGAMRCSGSQAPWIRNLRILNGKVELSGGSDVSSSGEIVQKNGFFSKRGDIKVRGTYTTSGITKSYSFSGKFSGKNGHIITLQGNRGPRNCTLHLVRQGLPPTLTAEWAAIDETHSSGAIDAEKFARRLKKTDPLVQSEEVQKEINTRRIEKANSPLTKSALDTSGLV